MNFRFDIFLEAFPAIIPFVKTTLILALISFFIALMLSFILALIIQYKILLISKMAEVYVSFFRSTPMISQLFFFYFGVTPFIPILKTSPPAVSVILVLAMNEAAFMSETIRGALSSVEKGQYESALVVGMTELQAMKRIIFPQAIRVALPGLSNSFIGIIKGTSLGFTIGVVEIMAEAKLLASKNYRIMEAYMAALIIYWVLIVILGRGQKFIEERANIAY